MLTICVLQGLFGSGSNAYLFFWFLRLHNQPSSVTEATQYLRQRSAFTASLLIKITLEIADIAIAGFMMSRIHKKYIMASVIILAVFSGSVVLLYYDLLKGMMI